jgi:hypothetical protein
MSATDTVKYIKSHMADPIVEYHRMAVKINKKTEQEKSRSIWDPRRSVNFL